LTLSARFEEALVYATQAHCRQMRKQTEVPYIAHVLGVTAIALEYGATEAEAIAALLHDVVEDCGGAPRLREIRERFGESVARIVEGCTDTDEKPKPPWRERKEQYLAHLAHADASTVLVSASDKLHNARSILRDLREEGDSVWTRFKGGKEGTLWYYKSLVAALRKRGKKELVSELEETVDQMALLAEAKPIEVN
jgi:(p)ppGpp synthase/HD superfamily hydrolase